MSRAAGSLVTVSWCDANGGGLCKPRCGREWESRINLDPLGRRGPEDWVWSCSSALESVVAHRTQDNSAMNGNGRRVWASRNFVQAPVQ
jgi:hypothetical protein